MSSTIENRLKELGVELPLAAAPAANYVPFAQTGSLLLTEGPFVESKAQLNGFFVIQARDLNEAIRLASLMPQAQAGVIEVRPIVESDQKMLLAKEK